GAARRAGHRGRARASPLDFPPHHLQVARAARPTRSRYLSRVASEQTLVLIKPDAMASGLAGEILRRFEARGLEVRAARVVHVDVALAERHYAEHAEKPFFGELVGFITSAPTLALVLEGEGAIATVRATMGATNP